MNSGVYRIRNQTTGDFYIGSSVDLRGRWWKHLNHLRRQIHSNPKLKNAWSKHGEKSFVFEVILYCDPEDCVMYEQIAMDCCQPRYNCVLIAGNGNWLGKKHSLETKEKMRRIKTGQKHSQKTKQLMSEQRRGENHCFYGKRHSAEARQKMSLVKMGKYLGENGPSSKLKKNDVKRIIRLLQSGMSGVDIAKQFCVTDSAISNIKLGKTWGHIKR